MCRQRVHEGGPDLSEVSSFTSTEDRRVLASGGAKTLGRVFKRTPSSQGSEMVNDMKRGPTKQGMSPIVPGATGSNYRFTARQGPRTMYQEPNKESRNTQLEAAARGVDITTAPGRARMSSRKQQQQRLDFAKHASSKQSAAALGASGTLTTSWVPRSERRGSGESRARRRRQTKEERRARAPRRQLALCCAGEVERRGFPSNKGGKKNKQPAAAATKTTT